MKEMLRKEMSIPFLSSENNGVQVSFEFFPPKTLQAEETLWQSLKLLAPIKPEFVSVTYGAGGSTRENTHRIVKNIKKETGLEVAAHLTCIGSSKAEIKEIADTYWAEGIKHIVALRGDLPEGHNHDHDDYKYANELVTDLKKYHDFEISVGGYPEKHPEAQTFEEDIENLKRKVDAGANRVISQFFIEPELFLNFYDKARNAGITVPIIPGILPITNIKTVSEFAKLCGASIPKWVYKIFEGLDEKSGTKQMLATAIAIEQCRVLYEHGISNFHFYTLNRAELVKAICLVLGKS